MMAKESMWIAVA